MEKPMQDIQDQHTAHEGMMQERQSKDVQAPQVIDTLVTPVFITTFPSLFAHSTDPNGESTGKYEVTMLFKRDVDITPLKTLLMNYVSATYGDNVPPGLIYPLYDGAKPHPYTKEVREHYKEYYVARATTQYKIPVYDQNRQLIIDPEEIYSGCFARAKINCYQWKFANKVGVNFGLIGYMKLANGKRLGNDVSVDDMLMAPIPQIKDAIQENDMPNLGGGILTSQNVPFTIDETAKSLDNIPF